MDYITKEMIVNRIIAGCLICDVGGIEYIIRPSTRMEKYRADIIYSQVLRDAIRKDVPTEEFIEKFLHIKGLWTDEDEKELKRLIDDMDSLRVSLFENFYMDEAKKIRGRLEWSREAIDTLYRKKHSYSTYTDRWLAACAKQRYIISSIIESDNEYLVNSVLATINKNYIDDKQLREISRTDPWRSIWTSKDDGLFDGACDMTQDQHRLVVYSVMYDRIYEHPERPSDDIIDDDDAIDGWKIIQHKKYKKDREDKSVIDRLSNNKIASAQEVFIPVKSEAELAVVSGLNDIGAKMVKKERSMKVAKEGAVEHQDFLDQRLLALGAFKNRK